MRVPELLMVAIDRPCGSCIQVSPTKNQENDDDENDNDVQRKQCTET